MPTTRRDADGHCYPLCTVAAGAGLALKVGANVVGSVVGGGAERALNGEKVVEGGEILKDAGAGVLGVGAEGAAERNFATQMIKRPSQL
jgi:hypothetical protein